MPTFIRDPVINAVNNGIRRGIQVALEARVYGSAVILTYSGIDCMAYLVMAESQEDVRKSDFIDWANRYIRFPCKEQLTGNDLYGARCAMLHNYSVASRMSRNGECRTIGYMDHAVPEVVYSPEHNESLVMVSIVGLAEAFLRGTDQCLINAFADRSRHAILERRLNSLVQAIPYRAD